jgi:uncharacterized protein (DUF58 family)
MQAQPKNLWSRITSAFRHKVTYAGAAFTLAMLLVGIAAVVSANNLLFLILAAMVSTLLVSGLVSRLSLAGLELDFFLPEHVTARRSFGGRVRVRNTKALLPSFSVHLSGATGSVLSTVYFPAIPGHAVLDETVEVCFARRGIYRESGFQFSTAFPFGFLERHAEVTLRRDVLVYPSIEPQPGFDDLLATVRGDFDSQVRGRGSDFYRIRPYEAFESARHVDWKATAHTGALQVREFAREQDRLLEIFFDLNVPHARLAWFEQAIDACAFLVWSIASRGGRVLFRTQEFEFSIPEMGDAYGVLKYLATVTPALGRPPIAPLDDDSCQVVLSATPTEPLVEAGWLQARILGPDAPPFSDAIG